MTDPNKMLNLVRYKNEQLGNQRTAEEIVAETNEALKDPARFVVDTHNEIGQPMTITQARQAGRNLGIDQTSFDGIEGVDYKNTFSDKIYDQGLKVNEAYNKVAVSGVDDPLMEEKVNNRLAGELSRENAERTSADAVDKKNVAPRTEEELTQKRNNIREGLIKDYTDHETMSASYKEALADKDLPFVPAVDIAKKYMNEHDEDPRKVVESTKAYFQIYKDALNTKIESLEGKIENADEKALIADMKSDNPTYNPAQDKSPRSREFTKYIETIAQSQIQSKEIDEWFGKAGPEGKSIATFADDLSEKTAAIQQKVDKGEHVRMKGHSFSSVPVVGDSMEWISASLYGARNLVRDIGESFRIPDDIEGEYEDLRGNFSKGGAKDMFNSVLKKKYDRDLQDFKQTVKASNYSGDVLGSYVDMNGVRVKINSRGEADGIVRSNGDIPAMENYSSFEKTMVKRFVDASPEKKVQYLKNQEKAFNFPALVSMVVDEGAQLIPDIGVAYFSGGTSALAGRAGAAFLGLKAVKAARVARASATIGAKLGEGAYTYLESYVSSRQNMLDLGYDTDVAESNANQLALWEGAVASAVDPISAKFGAAAGNKISRRIIDAGREAREAVAGASINVAAKDLMSEAYVKTWKDKAIKGLVGPSVGMTKDAAQEVFEEMLTLVGSAEIDKSFGQKGEITLNDVATTISVAAILGGGASGVASSFGGSKNFDKSLLYAGRNYEDFLIEVDNDEYQGKISDEEFNAKIGAVKIVSDGMKFSDEMSAEFGVQLQGSEVDSVEKLLIEASRGDGITDETKSAIRSLYQAYSEKITPETKDIADDTEKDDDAELKRSIREKYAQKQLPEGKKVAALPGGKKVHGLPAAGATDGRIDAELPNQSVRGPIIGEIDEALAGKDLDSVPVQLGGEEVRFDKNGKGDWVNRQTGKRATTIELSKLRNTVTERDGGLVTQEISGKAADNVGTTVTRDGEIGTIVAVEGGFAFESEGDQSFIESGEAQSLTDLGFEGVLNTPLIPKGNIKAVLQSTADNVDERNIIADIGPDGQGKINIFGNSYDYVETTYDEDGAPTVMMRNAEGTVNPVKGDNAYHIEKQRLAAEIAMSTYASEQGAKLAEGETEKGNQEKELNKQVDTAIDQGNYEESVQPPAPIGAPEIGQIQPEGSGGNPQSGSGTAATDQGGPESGSGSANTRGAAAVAGNPNANRGPVTGGANASATESGSTAQTSRSDSDGGFTRSKPYTADNGKSYYYSDGKWRNADTDRAAGGRELENLVEEIARKVIDSTTINNRASSIFGHKALIDSVLSSKKTISGEYIEQYIKEQDPELYALLLAMKSEMANGEFEVVGVDNTFDFDSIDDDGGMLASKSASATLELAVSRNNGNPMSQTISGKPSLLYASILALPGIDGDTVKADEYKARTYTDEFIDRFGTWVEDARNQSYVQVGGNDFITSEYAGISRNMVDAAEIIANIEEDIETLKKEKVAKAKLDAFEKLIIPTLGSEVLVPKLNKFQEDILMNPDLTAEEIAAGLKEGEDILSKNGSLMNSKIKESSIFSGDSISIPGFESFVSKNPEFKGVFDDWKKLLDEHTELLLTDLNAFRNSQSIEKLEAELVRYKNIRTEPRVVLLDRELGGKLDRNGEPLIEFVDRSAEGVIARAVKRNSGNPMSQTPDGKPSKLYASILALPEIAGDTDKADKYKAQVYSTEFTNWFGNWKKNIGGLFFFGPDGRVLSIAQENDLENENARYRELIDKPIPDNAFNEDGYRLPNSESLIYTPEELQEMKDIKEAYMNKVFTEDVSKVVDENGEPKLVYHVSSEEFDQFDPQFASMGGTFWFTENLDKIKDGETGAGLNPTKGQFIYEGFLNIKNQAGRSEYDAKGLGEIERDFDGIKLEDDYIIYNPTQIKSVFNEGEFDNDNPGIFASKQLDLFGMPINEDANIVNKESVTKTNPSKSVGLSPKLPSNERQEKKQGGQEQGSPVLTTYGSELIPKSSNSVPDRLDGQLREHQKTGVNAIVSAYNSGKKAFLLADGAGAGKTRQLIVAAKQVAAESGKKVYIVTESKQIIAGSFKGDADSMDYKNSTASNGNLSIGDDVEVITYHGFRKLDLGDSAAVFLDESQKASGVDSQTKKALDNYDGFVAFSSATPFDTSDKTLYLLPRLLGMSQNEFLEKVNARIDVRKSVINKGKKNESLKEDSEMVFNDGGTEFAKLMNTLHTDLISDGSMLHRRFEFFGNDKLLYQQEGVNELGDQATDIADAEEGIERYYADRAKAVFVTPTEARFGVTLEEKKRRLNEQKQNELKKLQETYKANKAFVAKIRKDVAEGKQVVLYGSNVGEKLKFHYGDQEYTRPSFLFSMQKLLKEAGVSFEVIDGANKEKGATVDRFQKGNNRVLLINQTGTTGINLNDTVGDSPRKLYIAGSVPNAIQLDQLKGRISRINNKSKAEAVYVTIPSETSEKVAAALAGKMAIMNSVLNGQQMNVPDPVDNTKKERATETVNLNQGDTQVGDYAIEQAFEKAFVVTGDTRAISAELKAAGAKYLKWSKASGNKGFRGWMFPNNKRAEVEQILGGNKGTFASKSQGGRSAVVETTNLATGIKRELEHTQPGSEGIFTAGYVVPSMGAGKKITMPNGDQSYEITSPNGNIIGRVRGVDFPGEGQSQKRGEVFILESKEKGKGYGQDLMLEALYLMRMNDIELVKFTSPSKEGSPFNDALERKGYITKVRSDERTGTAEYKINDKVVKDKFDEKVADESIKKEALRRINEGSPESTYSSADELKAALVAQNPELKTLLLIEDSTSIKLDMIEVDKESREQGVGTAVMEALVRYADATGKEINLIPGIQDDIKGTTSRSRLVRFYKRFGFVENKGRNKDFRRKGGSMFRTPTASFASKSQGPQPKYKQYAEEIIAQRRVHERYSQEEQSGLRKGGSVHVEAAVLLGGLQETDGENKQEREERLAEYLAKYAKKNGVWTEDIDETLGAQDSSGSEARVWYNPENKTVTKAVNPSGLSDGIESYLDRITIHNTLFPEMAYTVEGFGMMDIDGEKVFSVMVSQPMAIASNDKPVDAQESLDYLGDRGFDSHTNVFGISESVSDDYIITDVHSGNVVRGENGLFFIDPLIKMTPLKKRKMNKAKAQSLLSKSMEKQALDESIVAARAKFENAKRALAAKQSELGRRLRAANMKVHKGRDIGAGPLFSSEELGGINATAEDIAKILKPYEVAMNKAFREFERLTNAEIVETGSLFGDSKTSKEIKQQKTLFGARKDGSIDDALLNGFGENRDIPASILEDITLGADIPQQYIDHVAKKLADRAFKFSDAERLIMQNYKNEVSAALLTANLPKQEKKKTAKYKDGKLYVDFSSYTIEDIQEAFFEAIADTRNEEFKNRLRERLSGSKAFDQYFDQLVDADDAGPKFYNPGAEQKIGNEAPEAASAYNAADKIYGRLNMIVLPTGDIVKGRMVLVKSSDITPSHKPLDGFRDHDRMPMDVNGLNPNDRNYQRDNEGQKEVLGNAKDFSGRAFSGTPIVVTKDGVVISGNGRVMSHQVSHARKTYKSDDYYEILNFQVGIWFNKKPDIDLQAEGYVMAMEWEADNPSYTADEYGKFNLPNEKSKSESDKLRSVSRKVTQSARDQVTAAFDEYTKENGKQPSSPAKFYQTSARVQSLRDMLVKERVILSSEVNDYFDTNEETKAISLSRSGNELVRMIMIGGFLDDASIYEILDPKMAKPLQNLHQMAILINSSIGLGEDFDLSSDIKEAVSLLRRVKRSEKVDLAGFLSMKDLMEDFNYSTSSVFLALAMDGNIKLRDSFIKNYQQSIEKESGKQGQNTPGFEIEKASKYRAFKNIPGVILRQGKNKEIKLEPKDTQILRDLEARSFGPDVKYIYEPPVDKGPKSFFASKSSEKNVFLEMFMDAESNPDMKAQLELAAEKALAAVNPELVNMAKSFHGGAIAVAKNMLFGDPLVSKAKDKILANLSELNKNGLLKVDAHTLYDAHEVDFDAQGITIRDLQNILAENPDTTPIEKSQLEVRAIEDLRLDDNLAHTAAYLIDRGVPEHIANVAERIYDSLPNDVSRTKVALQMAIAMSLPNGNFNLASLYPWSDDQKALISERKRWTPENFDDKIDDEYVTHLSNPKDPELYADFEKFLKFALSASFENGIPLSPFLQSVHKKLSPETYKGLFKAGDTITVDGKQYNIHQVLADDNSVFYAATDVLTGIETVIDHSQDAPQLIHEELPASTEIVGAVTKAMKSLGVISPTTKIIYLTDAQMKAHQGSRTGIFSASYTPYDDTIRVNIDHAAPKDVFHEAAHVELLRKFNKNPKSVHLFHQAAIQALKAGNEYEQYLAKQLQGHVDQYKRGEEAGTGLTYNQLRAHEYLADLVGRLAATEQQISQPVWTNIISKIKQSLNRVLGGTQEITIEDSNDAINYINGLARAMSLGKPINAAGFTVNEADAVVDTASQFAAKKVGLFEQGKTYEIYNPKIGPQGFEVPTSLWREAKITFVHEGDDGNKIVKIGKEIFNQDNFYEKNGKIYMLSFAQSMIMPESAMSDAQLEALQDIVEKMRGGKSVNSAEQLYDEFKDIFKQQAISKNSVIEEWNRQESEEVHGEQESEHVEIMNEFFKGEDEKTLVNFTLQRLADVVPAKIAQELALSGRADVPKRTDQKVLEEIRTALSPFMSDPKGLHGLWKVLLASERRLSDVNSDSNRFPDGTPYPNSDVFSALMVMIPHLYSQMSESDVTGGFSSGVLMDMFEVSAANSNWSSRRLYGLRTLFTGVTSTAQMDLVFSMYEAALVASSLENKVGTQGDSVSEVIKAATEATKFTDAEIELMAITANESSRVREIIDGVDQIDDQLLVDLLSFSKGKFGGSGEGIFAAKTGANQGYYDVINEAFRKAYWTRRKNSIDNSDSGLFGELENGKSPITGIKATLDQLFELSSGMSAADFYDQNPDVLAELTSNYIRMEKSILKDSLKEDGNLDTRNVLLREYKKAKNETAADKRDPLDELESLFADRENGMIAIDRTIDYLGRQISYATTDEIRLEFVEMRKTLIKARENLMVDNKYANANNDQFNKAIRAGVKAIPVETLKKMGINIDKNSTDEQKSLATLNFLVRQTAENNEVSVKALAGKIVGLMNLSVSDSIELAELINKAYTDKIQKKKLQNLARLMKPKGLFNPKPESRQARLKKIYTDANFAFSSSKLTADLEEMVKNGTLTEDDFMKAFAKRFGLNEISKNQRERIGVLMEQMNRKDQEVVKEANKEFQKIMADATASDFQKFVKNIMSYRYLSLLSGWGTALISYSMSMALMAKGRGNDNIVMAMQAGNSVREFRRLRKEYPELFGNLFTKVGRQGSSVALAAQAIKRGSVIVSHEDNPDELISQIDLTVNKSLAKLRAQSIFGKAVFGDDTQARAMSELDRLGELNADGTIKGSPTSEYLKAEFEGHWLGNTAVANTAGVAAVLAKSFAYIVPSLMVRNLQFIDLLQNNGAIERATWMEAWDKTITDNPNLDATSSAFIQLVHENMGLGRVLGEDGEFKKDASGKEITFDEQVEAHILEVDSERSDAGRPLMTEREKAMLYKQQALDNRKHIFVDKIPPGLQSRADAGDQDAKDALDLMLRNRRSVSRIASDKIMDRSLMNPMVKGLLTGALANALQVPRKKFSQLDPNSSLPEKAAWATVAMISQTFFPIVKVVANGYYHSYAASLMPLAAKTAQYFGMKAGVMNDVESIRVDTRSGDTLINNISLKDLKKFDGINGLNEVLNTKNRNLSEVINALDKTKIERADFYTNIATGIAMSVLGLLARFELEEDDEGDLIVLKRDNWWTRNTKVAGNGTGNYFENKKIWGDKRKDNEFNVAGVHARWTEMPNAHLIGAIGMTHDDIDLYNYDPISYADRKPTLGRVFTNWSHRSFLGLLGEGFSMGANQLRTLVSETWKATEEKRGTEAQIAAIEMKRQKARNRLARVSAGLYNSTGLVPNVYRNSDKIVRTQQGDNKLDYTKADWASDVGVNPVLIGSMMEAVPILNAMYLDERIDITGNPMPERYDMVIIPDAIEEYVRVVKDDPVSNFINFNANVGDVKFYSFRNAARGSAAIGKKYYIGADDRFQLDEIWSNEFRKAMEDNIVKLQRMKPRDQERGVERIAKSIKRTKPYTDYVKNNRILKNKYK